MELPQETDLSHNYRANGVYLVFVYIANYFN